MTEFAPPAVAQASTSLLPPASSPSYGPPTFATTWKQSRLEGRDFAPQADGTLRCPDGSPLYPQERRPERDGTVRVLYAARIGHCRPCPLRDQCQWHGTSSKKPRRVSAVLHPRSSAPSLDDPPQVPLAAHPILWGDWERRSHRRKLVKLLRNQRVDVRLPATSPPAQPPPTRPLSRAERAHYRLSWTQRLARNATVAGSPSVSITLFGLPDAFAASLGLQRF